MKNIIIFKKKWIELIFIKVWTNGKHSLGFQYKFSQNKNKLLKCELFNLFLENL